MRKVVIDFLRVYDAAFAHEFQHKLSSLLTRARPRYAAFRRDTAVRTRMHECLNFCGYETVIDEKIFVDAQFGVTALQITGPVARHAMAQDQILGAGGRTNRVGLHKSHAVEGTLQGGWWKQASGDRKLPHPVESDRHVQMLSKLRRHGLRLKTEAKEHDHEEHDGSRRDSRGMLPSCSFVSFVVIGSCSKKTQGWLGLSGKRCAQ
jgi:hypothetical protein